MQFSYEENKIPYHSHRLNRIFRDWTAFVFGMGIFIMKEVWKDIKGFEGIYQISSLGRLKSLARVILLKNERKYPKKELIRSNVNKYGDYFRVVLSHKQKRKSTYIHYLVAHHFIGNRPSGYHIHHKNGNKQDNRVVNLEYLSAKTHSVIDCKRNPNKIKGMINYNQNIRPKIICQFSKDGVFIAEFKNGADAYKSTGVCSRNILQVASKEEYKLGATRKQAGGFIWIYKEDLGWY